jgi:general nucleoside transport system ATP-binding protein
MPLAIELRDIVKRFPGVVANDGVNLKVETGSIHAIIGENGAGKSTLMKTLYGAHQPDEGTITVNGAVRSFKSPKDAIAEGIGMVFQHFMLADNLSVWENVVLGNEPGSRFALGRKQARARVRELSERYGLDVDPDAMISELGVGQRQRVEILKVLYRGAKILILDEPTAVLVPQEVDELFASLRELVAQGSTIIFISHKLLEVLSVADAITVIRAGKTVAEIADPKTVTTHDLAELMVGSELPTPETQGSTVWDEVLLEVSNLTIEEAGQRPVAPSAPREDTAKASYFGLDRQQRVARGLDRDPAMAPAAKGTGKLALQDISIKIRKGEIVGIAGVEGNGQTELLETLIGIRTASRGTITFLGKDITRMSVKDRREGGIGYVPEDRHRDGLVLTFPLWENAALGHQSSAPFSKGPWMHPEGAREFTRRAIESFDVRTPGTDVAAVALSGGNQQKLIVGRELLTDPKILIAAHPTRGIDVGAQAAVWDAMRDAREQGLGILLISADLEELIGLSDRLLVLFHGEIVAELDPQQVNSAELGSYMTGARKAEGSAA